MILRFSLTVLAGSPLLLWETQMCNSQVDTTPRFLQFRSDSDHKYLQTCPVYIIVSEVVNGKVGINVFSSGL